MPSSKILIATDFSRSSEAAVQYAASLGRDGGSQLLVLHVIQPQPPYGAANMGLLVDQNEKLLHQMLDEAVNRDSGVDHESHLLVGRPADEILRFADENDVDLIVLGTHGRTGAARLLTGSVAETVIRMAKCPVLTIRQPAKQDTEES